MSKLRLKNTNGTDECSPYINDEAVKQVISKGHPVVDVAKQLGIPEIALQKWGSKL